MEIGTSAVTAGDMHQGQPLTAHSAGRRLGYLEQPLAAAGLLAAFVPCQCVISDERELVEPGPANSASARRLMALTRAGARANRPGTALGGATP